jgi:hypothetical protein
MQNEIECITTVTRGKETELEATVKKLTGLR